MAKMCERVKMEESIQFIFADGAGELVCDINEIPESLWTDIVVHGLAAKVGDSFAGAPDPAAALERAEAVWTNLTNGVWSNKGTGGTSYLITAIVNLSGETIDEVRAKVKGLDKEGLAKVSKDPEVAAEVARLKFEALAQKAAKAGGAKSLDSLFD